MTASDNLSADSFLDLSNAASWLGVDPARISRNGYPSSQDTHHHCLLADNQMLKPLFKETHFRASLQNAELRGATNPLFTGDMKEVDGTKILNLRSAYGDLKGPIGSPLTPAARLKTTGSGTIAAGNDTLHLCGAQGAAVAADGSNDTNDPLFFVDFPGYDYKYTADQSADVDNNQYYVAVFNPDGSKLILKYDSDTNQGNNGKTIGINGRVTGVTGFDGTKVLEGALAYPCNATGIVFGYAILMGADAVIRAYGENMTMVDDKDDYGFSHGIGYQAMFGDAVWKDRNNRVRNYVLGVYAYRPVGAK